MSSLIPKPKMTPVELGQLFIAKNRERESLNSVHLKRSRTLFQIMTYNVHMWEGIIGDIPVGPDESFQQIFQVIASVRPELLCLQEVIYHEPYLRHLYRIGYEVIVSCVINPSYRTNQLYMTMILCQKSLREQLVKYGQVDQKFSPICSSLLQCHLGQRTHTFHHEPLDQSETQDVEEKCFLKISLPAFDLVCVHLTAYDQTGERRLQELQIIHQSLSKNKRTILMGDFNMINREEYDSRYQEYIHSLEAKYGLTSREYQFVTQECRWIDLYSVIGRSLGTWENYSNWTNFRVDHIFAYNWTSQDLDHSKAFPWMLYQTASDHNPLILGLCHTFTSMKSFLETTQILSVDIYHRTLGRLHEVPVEILVWDELTQIPDSSKNGRKIFFNGQPPHEINWFELARMTEDHRVVVKSLYDFNDPHFTGTDASSMTMGKKSGIYLSAGLNNVVTAFMPKIQKTLRQEDQRFREIDPRLFVLYTFSMDLGDCDLKIKHLTVTDTGREFMSHEDEYYRTYDVLWYLYILKVTKRSLDLTALRHPQLSLEGIYLVYNEIIDEDEFGYLWSEFLKAQALSGEPLPSTIRPQQPFYLQLPKQTTTLPQTTLTLMKIWPPPDPPKRGQNIEQHGGRHIQPNHRCQGITQKGTRCKNGSNCHLHRK